MKRDFNDECLLQTVSSFERFIYLNKLWNNETMSKNNLFHTDRDKQSFRDEHIMLCFIFSLTLLHSGTIRFMFSTFLCSSTVFLPWLD